MRELSVTEVNVVSGGCLWAVGTGTVAGATVVGGAGAAVGSVVPVVGTAVGAVVGTAVGATVGAVTSAYQYCTDKK